jgi:hypothetical protein
MTLDEAIEHAGQVAAQKHEELPDCSCALEHLQLAEWLQELKQLRETKLEGVPAEMAMEMLEQSEALTADGFEDALIGYVERASQSPVALYSREACIQILMNRDGMSLDGANEFFDFNVVGAYVGDGTPAFATLIDNVCALCPGALAKGDTPTAH